MSYIEGHIKRDPSSGAVAIRTIFPEDDPTLSGQAWLQATANRGATFLRSADVANWEDLFVPDPAAPPDPYAPPTV